MKLKIGLKKYEVVKVNHWYETFKKTKKDTIYYYEHIKFLLTHNFDDSKDIIVTDSNYQVINIMKDVSKMRFIKFKTKTHIFLL